jgi:hypothetical protein
LGVATKLKTRGASVCLFINNLKRNKIMKQSAVEWLVEKLKSQGLLIGEINNLVAVREAKEMEKQQIIDVCNNAQKTDFYVKYYDAEQYYNETFKNKYETKT